MAVTVTDNTPSVIISQDGARGEAGTDGSDGAGFDQVRKSKIDNPLCHLFKKNKIDAVLSGSLTTTISTSSTYLDRYGVVKSASVDEDRQEFDGWLTEGSNENLLLHSEDLSNAAWLKTEVTISANADTAPDGSVTADKIIESSNTAFHYARQSFTSAVNAYSYSIYVKAAGRSECLVRFGDADLEGTLYVNLTDGSIVSQLNLDSVRIKSVSNGYYRISITDTSTTSATRHCYISPAVGGAANYAGDGTSGIYVWGGQLESSPMSSSYIKTTASPVTRAKNSITAQISNNVPPPTSDWSILTALKVNEISTGSIQSVFDVDCTTPLKFSLIQESASGTFLFRIGGATNTDIRLTGILSDTDYYITITHDSSTGSVTIYKNGDEQIVSAIVSDYPQLSSNNIHLGQSISGGSSLYGNIKDFMILDIALNPDEVMLWSGL